MVRNPDPRLPRWLVAMLALEGIGVLALWAASLRADAFGDGLFAYQLQGTVPILHVSAEVGMAAALLVGAIGAVRSARWSTPVLTFAAGMLAYGAVNSLGWALHNDAILLLPMAIALGSATCILALVTTERR